MIDQNIIQKAVDRVTAEVGVHRMYSPDMPDWLFSLPFGIYTVNDLIKISRTKRRNVAQVMKKYCKKIELIDSSKAHVKKCLYYWE